jgi:hypothetical protein
LALKQNKILSYHSFWLIQSGNKGAKTLGRATPAIMTLSNVAVSITTLSIVALSIIAHGIIALGIIVLSIIAPSITTLLSLITDSTHPYITQHNSFITLSIWTIGITTKIKLLYHSFRLIQSGNKGATTLGRATPAITTLSNVAVSIMTLILIALGIIAHGIIALGIIVLSIIAPSITTLLSLITIITQHSALYNSALG